MNLNLNRFVPESVRWLLAKQNTYKAGKIIKKAAIVNGVVLSDNILQVFEMTPTDDLSSDNVSYCLSGIKCHLNNYSLIFTGY